MIIDAHAHISKSNLAKPEILLKDMDLAAIDMTILVPGGMLDIRKMSDYTTLREEAEPVDPDNAFVAECIQKYPERFIGFYCFNPLNLEEDLDESFNGLKKDGFRGVKLAPLVHNISFSDPTIEKIVNCCGEYNMPLYTHVTANQVSSVAALATLIKKYPKTKFIIGHMGLGDVDQQAINIASKFSNVYLETSLAPLLSLKLAIKEVGVEKILFGTEFPLSDVVVELEKIKRLPICESEKNLILSGNISKILNIKVKV
ncbi:amidohydrolase family protein [Halobacillus sp. HZG1]|uniref:amidohydrolase family protein n=1 Tax=Halobacillus sp. HZG1 TaxID=3111769 RepID=UPI002DBA5028|nr:amidohydrolase family protein [Halobacillus sp. HZG1]MEC3885152.1 amidohydrolase family protein [Halobacillus sp. HZG1]